MQATIITTVKENIGDDFVREGLLFLLDSCVSFDKLELIHKHYPVTAVYGLEGLRNFRISRLVEPVSRIIGLRNRIDDANILIQSGAPIYWCHEGISHCADTVWFDPLIRKRFLPKRRGRLFLNLAGGSCQRYGSDSSELERCPRCKSYIREYFDVCDLTLLRDDLAKKMLNRAGRDAKVLPCASIFARDRFDIKPEPGEYIVLNFMENGGHYTFGQEIDGKKWRNQFICLANEISHIGRVVVACHTPHEEKLAKTLVPNVERFLVPNDHIGFMRFYAKAKWGIMNRVHGAFMMASFGKPAAVIGSDSRAKMIENLSLSSYYVNDVERVGVGALIDQVRSRCDSYPDEIEEIRRDSRCAYENELRAVLEK
jgi:hypothetical protein